MRQLLKHLSRPIALAFALGALGVGTALASAPWNGTCNTGEVCIYWDWHWEGPVAAMSGSNASYVGETYPNLTWSTNDSASSTKNLYTGNDAVWYQGTNYTGWPNQCINPGSGAYYVGIQLNDTFSSHLVSIDNNAC